MHNRLGISDCQAFHYRLTSRPSDVPRPCSYLSPFRLNLAPHQAPYYWNTQPVSQPHEGGSMKKLSFLASLVVLCLPLAASAQEVAPKVEIFGGYSFLRVDLGAVPAGTVPAGSVPTNLDTHGFNVSFAGNVARHVGIISEFSQFTKSDSASPVRSARHSSQRKSRALCSRLVWRGARQRRGFSSRGLSGRCGLCVRIHAGRRIRCQSA